MEENKRSRFRDLLYHAAHYLCVCRCIACGEVIGENEVFCEDCAPEFEAAMLSECGICGRSLCHCLCTDTALERSGIHKHVKLYRYLSDDYEAVGNRILYRLKKNDISTCFRFLGGRLATAVRELVPPRDDDIVSFVPRTPNRVLEYGFDQSARIAKEMGVALGLKTVKLLRRSQRAKTQKAIKTAAARTKNVSESLFLARGAERSVRGRRVFLVDDIVTSGASMRASARLLRAAGAREVIAVSVAVLTRTRNLRAEAAQNSHLPFYMR